MKNKPSLDEIFMAAPQAPARPSLDEIFTQPTQDRTIAESTLPQEPEAGFFASQRKRGGDLADAVNATSMTPTGSQQTPGETAAQFIGNNIGGTVGDIGGAIANTIKSAPIPQLGGTSPAQLVTLLRAGVPSINKKVLGAQEAIAPIAQLYEQNKATYDIQNPRAARNFEAIKGASNLLGLKVPGATEATKFGAGAVKEAFTPTPKALTSADRKLYAGALYDEVEATGGGLAPAARQVYRNKILEHADIGGERATTGKTTFEDMLEAADINKDKPLTLKGYKSLDSQLTDLIHQERSVGGISDKGRRLMDIQDTLDDLIDNPPPDMVMGGDKGFKLLKEANKEYRLTKQQEEIERIIRYANKTDNPATSMKAQARVLSENKKRMAGYSPEAREFIEKAATDSKFADFLRTTAGNRLIGGLVGGMMGAGGGAAIGGGVGALPGAIGGVITGAASRGAAKSLKTNQIKNIEKAVISQSKAGSIPREIYKLPPKEAKEAIRKLRAQEDKVPENVIEQAKALPAPDNTLMVNRQGDARVITTPESFAAQKSREVARDTGLTPDVRASQIRNQVEKAYEQRNLQRNTIKEEQIAKIAEQSSVPIEQLIEMADKNIKELSEIVGKKGSDTAFAQALRIAIRNKGKK